jgi:hypothetical protein
LAARDPPIGEENHPDDGGSTEQFEHRIEPGPIDDRAHSSREDPVEAAVQAVPGVAFEAKGFDQAGAGEFLRQE